MSIKLLLASDYAMVREGIRLLLRPAGEIELIGEVDRLPDAPQKFRDLKPDVALLDVAAVNSSGGLRTLRHLVEGSPQARAVVLTNNQDVSYARSILSAGARGYVLKDSLSGDLIAALRTTAAGNKFVDSRLSHLVGTTLDCKTRTRGPHLTQREREVLRHLAYGHTNSQTAAHLHLTLRTIETYRARICRRLHLRNRAELVQYAIVHGLLS